MVSKCGLLNSLKDLQKQDPSSILGPSTNITIAIGFKRNSKVPNKKLNNLVFDKPVAPGQIVTCKIQEGLFYTKILSGKVCDDLTFEVIAEKVVKNQVFKAGPPIEVPGKGTLFVVTLEENSAIPKEKDYVVINDELYIVVAVECARAIKVSNTIGLVVKLVSKYL